MLLKENQLYFQVLTNLTVQLQDVILQKDSAEFILPLGPNLTGGNNLNRI